MAKVPSKARNAMSRKNSRPISEMTVGELDAMAAEFDREFIADTFGPMDDEATAQLIHKLAEDVSLDVPDKIVAYLLKRIPRDFQSVKNAVTGINEESLRQKHKVTLPLIKTALGL